MIDPSAHLRAVVAVPVRNERDRIGACARALLAQDAMPSGSYGIIFFLNNCTDGTEGIVADFVATAAVPVRVVNRTYAAAHAGWARRSAMDEAARWLEEAGAPDGLILTTDADSRVGSDWIAKNLACIANGADAVAGRIVIDADDAAALPPAFHRRHRLETEYEAILTEIGARLDPEPGNPWPCHWARSGASLSVRRTVYNRIGGMPDLALGEDDAFVEALRVDNATVRHAMDVVVITSGRLHGRAMGGAADTIKLRTEQADAVCDRRLEALPRAMLRVLRRRRLRMLDTGRNKPLAAIKRLDAALAFRPLRPSRLPLQIKLARLVVATLRLTDRLSPAARRGGIVPFETGERSARSLPIA